ncbi:ABC transporter ATP-binding protein [Shinella sp.]|uniref:ABC transporter ATP-binding protein n=1 Tax=Shinella sp. TaxID=1870904 RepID=UPI0039E4BAD0
MATLLSVEDLQVHLHTRAGTLKALDRVSLRVEAGQTLAIVGESGCGKSLTALAVMRLLPDPPARIVGGRIQLEGRDLAAASESDMLKVRGKDVSMIFQDPMTSLNPVLSIGTQLVEVLRAHTPLRGAQAWARAKDLLELVSIPNAAARLHEFPHRLSGGMNQRVMIAMAIACNPRVLIADEPTTALDVTIQAQILDLLRTLQKERGMGLVMITHDLGVVAETADRVVVMYAGRKVEEAPVEALFAEPLHPYTQGLMGATPSAHGARGGRLADIPGMVPPLSELPAGCAFAARCPKAMARCRTERPELTAVGSLREVACFAAISTETVQGEVRESLVSA